MRHRRGWTEIVGIGAGIVVVEGPRHSARRILLYVAMILLGLSPIVIAVLRSAFGQSK